MYFLYTYEYGTLKPVKAILRRESGKRENDEGAEPNQGATYVYMEIYNETPCTTIIYQ
jgi:hypothetical protein